MSGRKIWQKRGSSSEAMYILGISCDYHDSSAVLLQDGQLIAGASEELFSRKKHDAGIPSRTIAWCL